MNPCSSSNLSGNPDTGLDQCLRSRSPEGVAPNDLSFHTFDEDSSVQGPSYSDRQRKSAEHWSEIRTRLQHTVIEAKIPHLDSTCMMCDELAITVCNDCGPRAFFCEEHVEQVHSTTNIFHRPHTWEVSYA